MDAFAKRVADLAGKTATKSREGEVLARRISARVREVAPTLEADGLPEDARAIEAMADALIQLAEELGWITREQMAVALCCHEDTQTRFKATARRT